MNNTTSSSVHNNGIYLIALARLLERAGFYGVRGIFLIFLTQSTLLLPIEEAVPFYTTMIYAGYAGNIIGAVLGDFAMGSKNTLILGTALSASGAFLLSLGNMDLLMASVLLFSLGSGLGTPNTMALFAKQYIGKQDKAFSGFSFLYAAINLGAVCSGIFMAVAGVENYSDIFMWCGIAILLSAIPILFVKEPKIVQEKNPVTSNKITGLMIAIFSGAIFWYLFELGSTGSWMRTYELGKQISIPGWFPDANVSLQGFATMIFSLVFFAFWIKTKTSFLFKIGIGIIISASSFIAIFFLPNQIDPMTGYESGEAVETAYANMLILILILSALGEALITPTILGVISKLSPPKFYGLFFAASIIAGFIINKFMEKSTRQLESELEDPIGMTFIAVILLLLLGTAILIINKFINKKYL